MIRDDGIGGENTVAETINSRLLVLSKKYEGSRMARKDRVWSTASIVNIAYGPHK